MIANLAAGAALVGATVLIHAMGLLVLTALLRKTIAETRLHHYRLGTISILAFTVLGLFVIHMAEIWTWAFAYVLVGALPTFGEALLFSTLSFSTLGAEDVSVVPFWRLFGSIEGVNGFLLIGWSTAYLIPAWTRYGPFHNDSDF